MNLLQYLQFHTEHNPTDPEIQTADMVFFKVGAVNEPDPELLELLLFKHEPAHGNDTNLFDGNEHSYLEVGAWIGDQGMALALMGLGSLIGLWDLLTPRTVLGADLPDDLVSQMAGAGFISVMVKPKSDPAL